MPAKPHRLFKVMYQHGEEQVRKFPVTASRTVYKKRVKFCEVHEWIDVTVTGIDDWERRHAGCGKTPLPENGVGLNLPRAMAEAAGANL